MIEGKQHVVAIELSKQGFDVRFKSHRRRLLAWAESEFDLSPTPQNQHRSHRRGDEKHEHPC